MGVLPLTSILSHKGRGGYDIRIFEAMTVLRQSLAMAMGIEQGQSTPYAKYGNIPRYSFPQRASRMFPGDMGSWFILTPVAL